VFAAVVDLLQPPNSTSVTEQRAMIANFNRLFILFSPLFFWLLFIGENATAYFNCHPAPHRGHIGAEIHNY
jgi:hypothetical protein